MAQEFKPGEIVPQSGIYTITHDPAHAGMPHEVTVIKGRRFPTCRHCKGISFELAHAAGHVGEIDDSVGAILYLEGASFVTGEILHVDGGQSAGH